MICKTKRPKTDWAKGLKELVRAVGHNELTHHAQIAIHFSDRNNHPLCGRPDLHNRSRDQHMDRRAAWQSFPTDTTNSGDHKKHAFRNSVNHFNPHPLQPPPPKSPTMVFETEILINAPAEKCYDILVDFASFEKWNPFIIKGSGKPQVDEWLKLTLRPPGGSGKFHVFD